MTSIDQIENYISDNAIPDSQIVSLFKDFINELLHAGKLESLSPKNKEFIERSLLNKPKGDEEKRILRSKLWALADQNKDNDPMLYNLIRGIIFIHSDESELELAQDPLIFYCLQFMNNISENLAINFLEFFEKQLKTKSIDS